MSWFTRPKRYTVIGKSAEGVEGKEGKEQAEPAAPLAKKKDIPSGVMTKCLGCGELLYTKNLESNDSVCYHCDYHFRMGARQRMRLTTDVDSFRELDKGLVSNDPLHFLDYQKKVEIARKKTGLDDAVITGYAEIRGKRCLLAISDFSFCGGSMGSVVGEKVTRAIERARDEKLPAVSISAGGGGARMQESMLSLMQMAKTSAAVANLKNAGIPFISVFTDPTMGGVAASYASLGDILIAEPGAMVGFAGARVIEQTIGRRLPEGFQRAEFLLEHGMLDMICHRSELKDTLGQLLDILWYARRGRRAATPESTVETPEPSEAEQSRRAREVLYLKNASA